MDNGTLQRVKRKTLSTLKEEVGVSVYQKGKYPSFSNLIEELIEKNRELEKKIKKELK